MALDIVKAAFMPLIDASILVAAREMKFADAEGLDLVLTRETSWANVRDRIAIGHFDVAHMLAPMPIAANLGLTPMRCELIAPMALGLGGNAVTVSKALSLDASQMLDAASAGTHLRGHIATRLKAGEPKLQFAVVHSHSAHNLELRYWLAACGIDPEKDIDIVILPPSYMVDALQHGTIDGYCVGEPWNSMAVERQSNWLIDCGPEIHRARRSGCRSSAEYVREDRDHPGPKVLPVEDLQSGSRVAACAPDKCAQRRAHDRDLPRRRPSPHAAPAIESCSRGKARFASPRSRRRFHSRS